MGLYQTGGIVVSGVNRWSGSDNGVGCNWHYHKKVGRLAASLSAPGALTIPLQLQVCEWKPFKRNTRITRLLNTGKVGKVRAQYREKPRIIQGT